VKRALAASGFGARLSPAALQAPDLVAASGLQWAAQRELMHDVIADIGPSRIRAIDATALLADVAGTAIACAEWLQLPIPRAALAGHATAAATRNAKALTMPYSPAQRAREADETADDFKAQLARAEAWLAEHVLPAMRPAPAATANDVVFAVDMSKSMSETDVSPSRLDAVKHALAGFVERDRIDRIGIVIFSREGKQLASLDASLHQLEQAIANLRMGEIPELGTAIGDGLATAVDEVRTGRTARQVVILISDGDSNYVTRFDPDQAIVTAKAVGVVVHTVLIGNDSPDDTPSTNPSLMERIAAATGGAFYRAPVAPALDRALDQIQASLRAEPIAR
jgi:Mg-chelatase subunit ChlD